MNHMISDPTDFAEEDNTASFDIRSFGLYRMSLLHVQSMSKMPVLFFCSYQMCQYHNSRTENASDLFSAFFYKL